MNQGFLLYISSVNCGFWSNLLQKSSVENLIFCAVKTLTAFYLERTKHGQLSKHKAMVTYQKLIFLCMMLKKGQTPFRNSVNTARFLKYNWPFFNLTPKRELLFPSKGRPSIKKANRHKKIKPPWKQIKHSFHHTHFLLFSPFFIRSYAFTRIFTEKNILDRNIFHGASWSCLKKLLNKNTSKQKDKRSSNECIYSCYHFIFTYNYSFLSKLI